MKELIKTNWLDRAILATFPAWGLRRHAWRELQASYRGGLSSRLSTTWENSRTFNNSTSTDRLSLGNMRDRARKVYRNNPIGRTLINAEIDNVVAEGFTLSATTDARDFNTESEENFAEWIDRADIRGLMSGGQLQRMLYQMFRVDGDAGCVLVDRGGESRLQLIAGDLVQNPDGKWSQSIYDGVEVDRVGRPIAFHILDQDENGKRSFARVASNNFLYLANLAESNSIRGETSFATIFELLDQLSAYNDSLVIAARMACIFGLIHKTVNPGKQMNLLGNLTNSQGNSQKAVTLENGMMKYIGSEDDIVQVQAQQPMQQAPDFIRAMLRQIGMPFDMPLEIIAKDMSTVNFASARIGLLGFYRSCRVKQQSFVKRFLDPVYRWWVSREVNKGAFTSAIPADYWSHQFLPRGWDYTDPVSEAQGDLLLMDMGIKDPFRISAEHGWDYETTLERMAAAKKLRDAAEHHEVRSSMTRDGQGEAATPDGPDPELERIKARADAYGVGVRAGAITPQAPDEDSFRTELSLPPLSKEAKSAWQKDKGVRRPITLVPTEGASPTIQRPPQEDDPYEQ